MANLDELIRSTRNAGYNPTSHVQPNVHWTNHDTIRRWWAALRKITDGKTSLLVLEELDQMETSEKPRFIYIIYIGQMNKKQKKGPNSMTDHIFVGQVDSRVNNTGLKMDPDSVLDYFQLQLFYVPCPEIK